MSFLRKVFPPSFISRASVPLRLILVWIALELAFVGLGSVTTAAWVSLTKSTFPSRWKLLQTSVRVKPPTGELETCLAQDCLVLPSRPHAMRV